MKVSPEETIAHLVTVISTRDEEIKLVFPRFHGQMIKRMLEDAAAEEPRRGREKGCVHGDSQG
jgi:hypothetical protein